MRPQGSTLKLRPPGEKNYSDHSAAGWREEQTGNNHESSECVFHRFLLLFLFIFLWLGGLRHYVCGRGVNKNN